MRQALCQELYLRDVFQSSLEHLRQEIASSPFADPAWTDNLAKVTCQLVVLELVFVIYEHYEQSVLQRLKLMDPDAGPGGQLHHPMLQVRKLKPRKRQGLAQSHPADNWS